MIKNNISLGYFTNKYKNFNVNNIYLQKIINYVIIYLVEIWRIIMVVNKDVCVSCQTCVDVCPVQAISMVDGVAYIDKDICVNCGACKDACPVNAITE